MIAEESHRPRLILDISIRIGIFCFVSVFCHQDTARLSSPKSKALKSVKCLKCKVPKVVDLYAYGVLFFTLAHFSSLLFSLCPLPSQGQACLRGSGDNFVAKKRKVKRELRTG